MEQRKRIREENKISVKNKLKIKEKIGGQIKFNTQKDKNCDTL